MANTQPITKVITGKVRFSYVHVFEPKAIEEGQTPKYSASILILKKDQKTIDNVKKAVEAAKQAGKVKFGGKIPAKLKLPLRDGDEERPDDENYAGCYFINANSTNAPGIVDENRQSIIDKDEFYSGCYGLASINFYAFNAAGNKGVAAGLNNLMKTDDGERLGGGSSAEEDFGAPEDDDLM